MNAIAEGQSSKSIMEAISERERELQAITNKLLEPGPGSLQATLDELRDFAISRLAKIRELITHPDSIDLARAVLAEHFGTFTLEPTVQGGEPVYLAHGKVDFFGDEANGWCRGPGSHQACACGFQHSPSCLAGVPLERVSVLLEHSSVKSDREVLGAVGPKAAATS